MKQKVLSGLKNSTRLLYLRVPPAAGQVKILTFPVKMKKVNKQCLLDTPRTVRFSEKTWQVIVQKSRP